MERTERQERLISALNESNEPLTGTQLAALCNVTRQVVVHDIALLRAAGWMIHSTPRGYWLETASGEKLQYVLSVGHKPDLTLAELYTLVDYGIAVLDVFVEHPVYGELRGTLHLTSRRDVDAFVENVANSNAPLLSSLTEGDHFHTVEAPDLQSLQEAVEKLREMGIRVDEL